ncbi:MAG: DNA polymerase III subunit alpha, partial [bacterium]|nr:DNA polymerase III subunit alpha [bacterium]
EGNPRHTSQHACGIVIGDVPLVERVPILAGQKEDMAYVTQYSLNSAEAAGLVKMDFLGLSNLTIIQDALDIIRAVHGVEIDIGNIPLDDEKAFELLGRGDTTGVFQLESDGMKRYIRDLKPTQIEDIIAMVSLYRPGPLSAGMVPKYINRKNGREKVSYDHPMMKEILEETYGVTVYQEQIMKISRKLAGFTAGEADTLRKAMGKKKRDVLAKMYSSFVEGCIANTVPKQTAEQIWKDWEGFADYAFNKSHAACYAMIAYRTAYLKAHYTPEFMAALMNSDINTLDRITIEVEECSRLGITVLPPDVNESFPGFAVVPGTGNIRWGLHAIKNVGTEVAKAITRERKEHGLYKDLADFARRVPNEQFNKKSLEALIKSGALDRFAARGDLIESMDQLLMFNKQVHKEKSTNQISMFDFSPSMNEAELTLRKGKEIGIGQLLSWERELLGIYVSNHPMRDFEEELKPYVVEAGTLDQYEDGHMGNLVGVIIEAKKILTRKKQEPMAFVRLEDWSGSAEVVVFPKLYKKVQHILEPGAYLVLKGKISIRDRDERKEWSMLADEITVFKEQDKDELIHMLRGGGWDTSFEKQDQTEALPEVPGVSILVPTVPTHELIDALRKTLKESPGDVPVYLIVQSGGEERRIQTEYTIDPTAHLLERLKELVGAENLVHSFAII